MNTFAQGLSQRLFHEEQLYTDLMNAAAAKGLKQTIEVLPYAKAMHQGQVRKGQDRIPYIYHPLLVACHGLALGLEDDNFISAALLHDVCEDCQVSWEELPVNEETRSAVFLLTKDPSPEGKTEAGKQNYYSAIAKNRTATMIKLLDRCNNISGMAAGFSEKKMINYMKETEKWIYPLLQKAQKNFPEYSNQLFLIQYHMASVIETIKYQIGV